jgi:hypothetical protein
MADGFDSYITADGYIFPAPRMSAVYVPVVTGPYSPPVPPNYTGRLEDYIGQRIAESEARILELQHEKVPLFKREKEIKDSVKAVSRMLVAKKGLLSRKGLFESHDEYDKRRQAKLLERAELRQKYSYLNRQNENEIDKWCLLNTSVQVWDTGHIMPVKIKGQAARRIDGTLSLIMCYEMLRRYRTEFQNALGVN